MEDSIDGSWDFVISKKLSCALVIPFATNLYVREVGAFTFCVGLAWLARCVLPHQFMTRNEAGFSLSLEIRTPRGLGIFLRTAARYACHLK